MSNLSMRPAPPPGIYIQPWLGAFKGSTQERFAAFAETCKKAKAHGARGVVAHGFPRGMARDWDGLAVIMRNEGLVSCASFGLDGRRDEDGTTLTVAEKGKLVGLVAAQEDCDGVWLDAEGRWDRDEKPADDMNEAGALRLGHELRAEAPAAWVADQPWPILDMHGDVRRSARPIEKGGVFAGFPVDEFAHSCVNGDRAVQLYWANWYGSWGDDAYPRLAKWHAQSWQDAQQALARVGLARPLGATIQGYGHNPDKGHHWHSLIHAMLTYAVERSSRLVIWSEPTPTPMVWEAVSIVAFLATSAQPNDTADTIIRRHQAALGVTVDGLFGLGTLAAHRAS